MSGDAAQALRDATRALAAISDTPRLDAELLLAYALGMPRGALLLKLDRLDVPPDYAALLERRMEGEPIAYILGETEFFGLPIGVTPAVLVPRGDSETMIDRASRLFPADAPLRIIDLGTGSGALLLAALHHFRSAQGVGIDVSDAALPVARDNARRLGLDKRSRFDLCDWTQERWTDALGGPFDMILANPPYIATGEPLDAQVRDHEPHGALFAGPDGLDAYRILIPALHGLLAPDGMAFLEIGWRQARAVGRIAAAEGFQIGTVRDLAGRDRVIELHRPKKNLGFPN